MERLVFMDGSVIAAGEPGKSAICQVTWTQNRNEGAELTLGSACVATLEIQLFSPKKPDIPPGTRFQYQIDGNLLWIFHCRELRRTGKHRYTLYAADAMSLFQRDLGDLDTQGTVMEVLRRLCDHCGVICAVETLPGGDLAVPGMGGVSCWELLQFLGQAAGRYFYIDELEQLRDGWYEEISSIDNYHQLTIAEYTTHPIEAVWLRQTQTDTGSVYPDSLKEKNTLIIQGNPIFAGDSVAVAQRLLGQLEGFQHTPFTCKLLPGQWVNPGSLVEFPDQDGAVHTGAVMQWQMKNGVLTIRGVGSHKLQSKHAFHHLSLRDLSGQMLSIDRETQGLKVSHSDLRGNLGSLELSLEGISTRLTQVTQEADLLTTQQTVLSQKADGLSVSVSQLTGSLDHKTDREEFSQVTEHFQFDAGGMTIRNSASGMGIQVSENRVAFTGGEDPSTVILPDTMQTARLTVGKRLDMGSFSWLPRTNGNLSLRYTGE